MLSAAAARGGCASGRGAVGAITPLTLVLLLVLPLLVAVAVAIATVVVRIGQILIVDATHDLDVAARRRREGGHVLHEAQRPRVPQHNTQTIVLGLDRQ